MKNLSPPCSRQNTRRRVLIVPWPPRHGVIILLPFFSVPFGFLPFRARRFRPILLAVSSFSVPASRGALQSLEIHAHDPYCFGRFNLHERSLLVF